MIIKLEFDLHSHFLFVPDNYTLNLTTLRDEFLDWMQEQPECIISTYDKKLAYSYNEETFLKYINTVVLSDSNEKAYFVNTKNQNSKSKNRITF